MEYKFEAFIPTRKLVENLSTGELFVEWTDSTIMMATDENDKNNTFRRCVNLKTGVIVYFDLDTEVRTIKLIEPPVFGLA